MCLNRRTGEHPPLPAGLKPHPCHPLAIRSGHKVNFLLTIFLLAVLSSCSYFQSNELINGSQAPEISAPDRSGEPLALSAFRGKLVLVNFWASWCKPCREENPKLKALYDKYKDASFKKAEGFTVFSVSLDSEKDNWLKAIRDDGLDWENHVCDLHGWNSPAADSFRVSSIPSAFLIDPSGIIIGKNLKIKEFDKLLGMLVQNRQTPPQ
jgi:thiol-disulfide isomerase/thioredoxin